MNPNENFNSAVLKLAAEKAPASEVPLPEILTTREEFSHFYKKFMAPDAGHELIRSRKDSMLKAFSGDKGMLDEMARAYACRFAQSRPVLNVAVVDKEAAQLFDAIHETRREEIVLMAQAKKHPVKTALNKIEQQYYAVASKLHGDMEEQHSKFGRLATGKLIPGAGLDAVELAYFDATKAIAKYAAMKGYLGGKINNI